MKNRKVTATPAPAAEPPPANVRVETLHAQALNRLVRWLSAAIFGGCVAGAAIYTKIFFPDAGASQESILFCILVAGTLCIVALSEVYLEWRDVCDATERLELAKEARAKIQRR